MKDKVDYFTGELLDSAAVPSEGIKGKHKRLPRQSCTTPPEGAKPVISGEPLGWSRSVVSVSIVARDWGISPRRVRVMLTEGRLNGRQLENGYWEVYYPYSYVFGTRGPAIKRQRSIRPKNQEKRFSVSFDRLAVSKKRY